MEDLRPTPQEVEEAFQKLGEAIRKTAQETAQELQKLRQTIIRTAFAFDGLQAILNPWKVRHEQNRRIKSLFRRVLGKRFYNIR